MPDVLWLFEFPTAGGGERSLLATLPELRSAGFHIRALAPSDGPLAAKLDGCAIERIAFGVNDDAGHRRPRDELRRHLGEILTQHRPALLHANSLAMGRLSGPVVDDAGVASITHLRDILKLSRGAVADLNCHSRLLAVSQATRDYHLAQGLSSTKTFVAYNGVHLDRFRPRAASGWLHRKLKITPGVPLVGAIGQIIIRKGLDVLARAAATLTSRSPATDYVIVGERYSRKAEAAQYERELHRLFAQAGLAGRVHFLGERDDVDRLLPELALLVHPARQEPLGRVLLEAAAAGVPTIATDVGGTREIFPAEANAAVLVPPDDPDALAEAMVRVMNDSQLRASLKVAARRRAEEMFDAPVAGAALAEHYRQVLALAQPHPPPSVGAGP